MEAVPNRHGGHRLAGLVRGKRHPLEQPSLQPLTRPHPGNQDTFRLDGAATEWLARSPPVSQISDRASRRARSREGNTLPRSPPAAPSAAALPRSRSTDQAQPAPEEVAELRLDEPGQALALAQTRGLGAERLEVFMHNPVERSCGRTPRFVGRGRQRHALERCGRRAMRGRLESRDMHRAGPTNLAFSPYANALGLGRFFNAGSEVFTFLELQPGSTCVPVRGGASLEWGRGHLAP